MAVLPTARPVRAADPILIGEIDSRTGLHGVVALVGGYVDSLVGPVSEVAERTGVPYLAAASLDERLTARGYRYFFRISSRSGPALLDDPELRRALLDFRQETRA